MPQSLLTQYSLSQYEGVHAGRSSRVECRHDPNTLASVKRLSPLVVIALAVAAAIAILRSSETEASEVWKPVDPS
jgi:hypothetical protein